MYLLEAIDTGNAYFRGRDANDRTILFVQVVNEEDPTAAHDGKLQG